MIAYHGSLVKGLSVLKPFSKESSNLKYPCVYLSTNKHLAALYIWNRPYKWMNFSFAEDGTLIYTESFPNALKEFYAGVSGCVYTCEGEFEYDPNIKINVAVSSRMAVSVSAIDYVEDCYERLLEYERDGFLRINHFEDMNEELHESERRMILGAIRRMNLLRGVHPMSPFVMEKFPVIWQEALEAQKGNAI